MSGQYSMMTLGSYTFELDTAVFQELKRTTEYLWPSQQRFGSAPAVQSTGLGDDVITLPGVIFPEWFSDTSQLDTMRDLAAEMKPLTMIDGRGNVMGQWVIERVEETQTVFAQAGVARKQEFSLTLKKYDDGGSGDILTSILDGVSESTGAVIGLSALPAIPSFFSDAVAMVKTVTDTANAALRNAGTIAGKIGSAISSISHITGALGIHSAAITNALTRSLNVTNSIRTSTSDGLDLLGRVQTVASASTAAKNVFNDLSNLVQPATTSSSEIKAALDALRSEGASDATLTIVTDSLVSVNKATALASSLRDNTNTIIIRAKP